MATFEEAVRSGITNWGTFSGRSSRSEFWWFYLFNILLFMAFGLLMVFLQLLGDFAEKMGFLLLLALVGWFFISTASLIVRRLHDSNLSGWWAFLVLIPYLGEVAMIYFGLRSTRPGPIESVKVS